MNAFLIIGTLVIFFIGILHVYYILMNIDILTEHINENIVDFKNEILQEISKTNRKIEMLLKEKEVKK